MINVLRVFLFYLLLSLVACSQGDQHPVSTADDPVAAEAGSRQLRIYRDALQQGSSEDIRVDAAVGLLLQNNAQSRNALLSVLKSSENPHARQAVCKALIKSRGLSQTIDFLGVFRDPLLDILKSEATEEAKLAAEALLLFDYSEVAEVINETLQNKELGLQIRLNSIYALQLRPEPMALRSLIRLLDDPDVEVAKAAETALQDTFGIPVGTSRKVWADILVELQLKSPEEIRRERLLRQEERLRETQAECERWQKLYLASLDKQYELLDEPKSKKMVLELMESDLTPIRLWALKKVTKHPVTGDELRAKLLSLLSDASRDVRLQTASVLMHKSDLDPAHVLLERLGVEEDAEVKLAMLEALGEACFFAFSPNSPVKLSDEVKTKTLEIASEYLKSDSAADSAKGAEVIRKILELNNLSHDSLKFYLGLLKDRYVRSLSEDGEFRAEMLGILAHLCGQGGAKEPACALFGPFFVDALVVDNNPSLRLAAAQGLSYVDKVRALELFKENSLMRDQSPAVQQVVIHVAGQAGDASDLPVLLELLAANGQTDYVWQAIRDICRRENTEFLMQWLPTLETAGVKGDYIRNILDIAEQKAADEKNEPLRIQIQERILSDLADQKAWDSGLAYLDKVGYSSLENGFSAASNASALKIYLYTDSADSAVLVIQAGLKKADLTDADPLVGVLRDYVAAESVRFENKSNLIKKLASIPSDNRPNWAAVFGSLEKQLKQLDQPAPEVISADKEASAVQEQNQEDPETLK